MPSTISTLTPLAQITRQGWTLTLGMQSDKDVLCRLEDRWGQPVKVPFDIYISPFVLQKIQESMEVGCDIASLSPAELLQAAVTQLVKKPYAECLEVNDYNFEVIPKEDGSLRVLVAETGLFGGINKDDAYVLSGVQFIAGVALSCTWFGAVPGSMLISSAVAGGMEAYNSKSEEIDNKQFAKSSLIGGTVGLATGGLGALNPGAHLLGEVGKEAVSLSAKVVTGTACGATGAVTNAALKGEEITVKKVAISSLTGGLGGGVSHVVSNTVAQQLSDQVDDAATAFIQGAAKEGAGGATAALVTTVTDNALNGKPVTDNLLESVVLSTATSATLGGVNAAARKYSQQSSSASASDDVDLEEPPGQQSSHTTEDLERLKQEVSTAEANKQKAEADLNAAKTAKQNYDASVDKAFDDKIKGKTSVKVNGDDKHYDHKGAAQQVKDKGGKVEYLQHGLKGRKLGGLGHRKRDYAEFPNDANVNLQDARQQYDQSQAQASEARAKYAEAKAQYDKAKPVIPEAPKQTEPMKESSQYSSDSPSQPPIVPLPPGGRPPSGPEGAAENINHIHELPYAVEPSEQFDCDWEELQRHIVLVKSFAESIDNISSEGGIGHHLDYEQRQFRSNLIGRPYTQWNWNQLSQPHLNGNCESDRIAVLEPLSAFDGTAAPCPYTVTPYATIVFGEHKLSQQAKILVPITQLEKVRRHLKDFQGEIITYDPETIKLRQAIFKALHHHFPQCWDLCDQQGVAVGNRVMHSDKGYSEVTCIRDHNEHVIPLIQGEGSEPEQRLSRAMRQVSEGRQHILLNVNSVLYRLELDANNPYFNLLRSFHRQDRSQILSSHFFVANMHHPQDLMTLGALSAFECYLELTENAHPASGAHKVAEYLINEALYADIISLSYLRDEGSSIRLSPLEARILINSNSVFLVNLLQNIYDCRKLRCDEDTGEERRQLDQAWAFFEIYRNLLKVYLNDFSESLKIMTKQLSSDNGIARVLENEVFMERVRLESQEEWGAVEIPENIDFDLDKSWPLKGALDLYVDKVLHSLPDSFSQLISLHRYMQSLSATDRERGYQNNIICNLLKNVIKEKAYSFQRCQSQRDYVLGAKLAYSSGPLMQYGLEEIHAMQKVGNCLFDCVVHQFNADNDSLQMTSAALRVQLISYMQEHKLDYEESIASGGQLKRTLDDEEAVFEFTYSDWDGYCKLMSQDRVWGDELAIKALSAMLGRPIVVISDEQDSVLIYNEASDKPPFFLHYCNGQHFTLAVPIKGLNVEDAYQIIRHINTRRFFIRAQATGEQRWELVQQRIRDAQHNNGSLDLSSLKLSTAEINKLVWLTRGFAGIKTLNLKNNNLDDLAVVILAAALEKSCSLENCYLGDNFISSECLQHFNRNIGEKLRDNYQHAHDSNNIIGGLNYGQRLIVDCFVDAILEDNSFKLCPPVYQLRLWDMLQQENIDALKRWVIQNNMSDLEDSCMQLHEILHHPCPQNCAVGYPYIREIPDGLQREEDGFTYVYSRPIEGGGYIKECQGLLGLTWQYVDIDVEALEQIKACHPQQIASDAQGSNLDWMTAMPLPETATVTKLQVVTYLQQKWQQTCAVRIIESKRQQLLHSTHGPGLFNSAEAQLADEYDQLNDLNLN